MATGDAGWLPLIVGVDDRTRRDGGEVFSGLVGLSPESEVPAGTEAAGTADGARAAEDSGALSWADGGNCVAVSSTLNK